MVAAVVVLMLAVDVRAWPVKLKDSSCITADKYVYPFCSFCDSPAELSTGYKYVTTTFDLGGLEPEYDESNSTYYVRLTGSSRISLGATYVAVAASDESGAVLVNSPVYIYNAESKRALQWRQEGRDQYFLIEEEMSSVTEAGAPFRFVRSAVGEAENRVAPLECPLSLSSDVQCQTYFLVSDPDSSTGYTDAGLVSYLEGEFGYVMAAPVGTTGYLPFTILETTSSTATSAISVPAVRTVSQL